MTTGQTRALNILSPIALLAVWQLAVTAGLVDRRMFPPPSEILTTLFQMARGGDLWINLLASLWRVGAGLALGSFAGIVVGVSMGLSALIRAIIQPLVSATYPVPRTAIVPLFLIIFGIGEVAKIMVVATSVFYVVLIASMTGVMSIERTYIDVGRDLRISRFQAFRTIALPGALPAVIGGLKLGAGIAFIVLVVAEYTGSQTGIGYMIWEGWQTLDIDQMYVGLLMIAVIGWLVSLLMDEFEYLAVPWRRHR